MILCDANVLVALANDNDSHHGLARTDSRRLIRRGLLVTEPVIAETIALLPGAHQRRRLVAVLMELNITPLATAASAAMFAAVFAWLARYGEHEPDWADAHLAVLCGVDHRLSVWTYDREFRTIWRRPDGKPIAVVGTDAR